MARPPVDKRLQNIESSLDGIMNKLCEMSSCKPKDTKNNIEEGSVD